MPNTSNRKEPKRKFALWIRESTLDKVRKLYKTDNCSSQSEFIEKAILFYTGYLSAEENKSYLSGIVTSTLKGIVAESDNRQKDMGHLYYDLTLLPSQKMREEYRLFLTERGQEKTIQTIDHDKSLYHHLCRFLTSQRKRPESFLAWDEETWIKNLRKWMLKNEMPWYIEKVSVYGSVSQGEARLPRYVRQETAERVFDFEKKTVTLNSGYDMPLNGLGTYSLEDDVCVKSVSEALKRGVKVTVTSSGKKTSTWLKIKVTNKAKTPVFNFKKKMVKLNSGYDMPLNGLGTYSLEDDVCVKSVSEALKRGVRIRL